MRLMRILIVLILCVKSLYRALPVQSKALENVDDQLFWQVAWFSEDSKPESPFTSDSKKITAKSIFITPNFVNQPAQYCPDGYRIDNGKCIKIITLKQTSEEVLATRLESLFTTDDTTNFDYDYGDSLEDHTSNDNDRNVDINLPLVPILNESNEDTDHSNSINAKNITVKEQETTTDTSFIASHTFRDFHDENKTDSVEVIITTLSNDDDIGNMSSNSTSQTTTYEHNQMHPRDDNDYVTEKPSADVSKIEHISSSTIAPDSSTTTVSTTAITLEYESITEMNSNENETSVMQDRSSEDNQNVEPSSSLLPMADESLERENSTKNFTIIDSINSSSDGDDDEILSNSTVLDYNENSQTEVAIIESSDTINFDDSSFLLNDSLIMIDSNASMLASGNSNIDYDDITTIDPFNVRNYDETTSSDNNLALTTELDVNLSTTTIKELGTTVHDETSKFLYHHDDVLTTKITTTVASTVAPTIESSSHAAVKGSKLKFPDEEISSNRVRFPDDDEIATTTRRRLLPVSTKISWPRENNNRLTTNIFQFWNQQPLLNDFQQRARENAKSFRSDDFFPYTRKVQIVTPQRYNYNLNYFISSINSNAQKRNAPKH